MRDSTVNEGGIFVDLLALLADKKKKAIENNKQPFAKATKAKNNNNKMPMRKSGRGK